MQPITFAFGTSTEFRALTPVLVGGLMTILITLMNFGFKGRSEFNRICLLTLGMMPFLVSFLLHAPFLPNLLTRPGPSVSDRLLDLFLVLVLLTPSYPISFIIAGTVVIKRRLTGWQPVNGRYGICVALFLVHVLGLFWTYGLRTIS